MQRGWRWAWLAAGLVCALPVKAQPSVTSGDWQLERTVALSNAQGAHFGPNGSVYVGRRESPGSGGVYRITDTGTEQVASGDRPAAVLVASDGDIFFSEDYDGLIMRVPAGGDTAEVWVSGFHSGDDDPVGMAIAPADHDGSVIPAGEALVVDRGYNGATDQIWSWDPEAMEGEMQFRADDGTLVDALDLAIGASAAWLIDRDTDAGTGTIYALASGGTLTALTLDEDVNEPVGIALDPQAPGELLVTDVAGDRLVRVNTNDTPATVTDVITGLPLGSSSWASVDLSVDGFEMAVTTPGEVHLFTRMVQNGTDAGVADGGQTLADGGATDGGAADGGAAGTGPDGGVADAGGTGGVGGSAVTGGAGGMGMGGAGGMGAVGGMNGTGGMDGAGGSEPDSGMMSDAGDMMDGADNGGCNCSVLSTDRADLAGGLLLALAVAFGLRRRRRR